jgi:hypothetical protein
MKKGIVLSLLISLIGLTFFVTPGEGRTVSYYSGDAINYNGHLYVGTVNSGSFELFSLEGNELYRKAIISSVDQESQVFVDVLFSKENGSLYVYLTNGRYLYKYAINNSLSPSLVTKVKDNSWDWFSDLAMVNGQLVTTGSKGIKVWNKELVVINSYSMITDKNLGSIAYSSNGDTAVVLKSDQAKIFSLTNRNEIADSVLISNDERTNRTALIDSSSKTIYMVDDRALQAVNYNGVVTKQFNHISYSGYDVSASADSNYLYFSDGVGIVKVDKENLKPIDWAYAYKGNQVGSWSMGLKVVNGDDGDQVVVFNGSNIWVLNKNLTTIADYESKDNDVRPIENLSLSADKNTAATGAQVSLSGTGYGLNENLKIQFAKSITNIKADENGRFETVLTVPSVLPSQNSDIKVTGLDTKRTYSTSFKIQ